MPTVFWVARRFGMHLAESLQLIHRQVITRQMQQRILQHAPVTGGKDKPVSIDPTWVFGIEVEVLGPQCVTDRSRSQGKPSVSALRLFDCV
jgi:hypothetical protein